MALTRKITCIGLRDRSRNAHPLQIPNRSSTEIMEPRIGLQRHNRLSFFRSALVGDDLAVLSAQRTLGHRQSGFPTGGRPAESAHAIPISAPHG